jgi:hypothetical protein
VLKPNLSWVEPLGRGAGLAEEASLAGWDSARGRPDAGALFGNGFRSRYTRRILLLAQSPTRRSACGRPMWHTRDRRVVICTPAGLARVATLTAEPALSPRLTRNGRGDRSPLDPTDAPDVVSEASVGLAPSPVHRPFARVLQPAHARPRTPAPTIAIVIQNADEAAACIAELLDPSGEPPARVTVIGVPHVPWLWQMAVIAGMLDPAEQLREAAATIEPVARAAMRCLPASTEGVYWVSRGPWAWAVRRLVARAPCDQLMIGARRWSKRGLLAWTALWNTGVTIRFITSGGPRR